MLFDWFVVTVSRAVGAHVVAAPKFWNNEHSEMIRKICKNTIADETVTNRSSSVIDNTSLMRTYITVFEPKLRTCAFLRLCRATDDSGIFLKDDGGCGIWSVEGVCMPYDDREIFFAMIPSLVFWFSKNRNSLYRRTFEIAADGCIEIPIVVDPYSESDIPEDLVAELPEGKDRLAFLELCSRIKYSNRPCSLVYGSLAEMLSSRLSNEVSFDEIISLDEFCHMTKFDPLNEMELAEKRTTERKHRKVRLMFNIGDRRKQGSYRFWSINDCAEPAKEILPGDVMELGNEPEISFMALVVEGETIRELARQLRWDVPDNSTPADRLFTFGLGE